MENQRTEYIQADDYERSESRQSQKKRLLRARFYDSLGTP